MRHRLALAKYSHWSPFITKCALQIGGLRLDVHSIIGWLRCAGEDLHSPRCRAPGLNAFLAINLQLCRPASHVSSSGHHDREARCFTSCLARGRCPSQGPLLHAVGCWFACKTTPKRVYCTERWPCEYWFVSK